MFGELIIMIVYLPILTLEGVEGKLFHPMAQTVLFALLGSLVLSLTLMPALASWFLPRRAEDREPWVVAQVPGVLPARAHLGACRIVSTWCSWRRPFWRRPASWPRNLAPNSFPGSANTRS